MKGESLQRKLLHKRLGGIGMAGDGVQVVVDGVTGVGKSSLVKIIAEEFGFIPFSEMFEDENRLLHKFFHDREKWAFPMQTNFLTNRFRQYQEAMRCGKAVMDRCIYSDRIFAQMYLAQGYLKPEEYAVYENLLQALLEHCQPPRLMIYLKVSTDEAIRRIRKRGRPDELEVEREYWDMLNRFYSSNYEGYNASDLLVIEVEGLDYVHRERDREFMVKTIASALEKVKTARKPA